MPINQELAYRQAAVAEVYFKSANYIFFSDNKGYLRFVHFADKSKTPDYHKVYAGRGPVTAKEHDGRLMVYIIGNDDYLKEYVLGSNGWEQGSLITKHEHDFKASKDSVLVALLQPHRLLFNSADTSPGKNPKLFTQITWSQANNWDKGVQLGDLTAFSEV